ncbi:MAG: hypothetical protein AABW75_01880 [Nanoarchaeota archaeon]
MISLEKIIGKINGTIKWSILSSILATQLLTGDFMRAETQPIKNVSREEILQHKEKFYPHLVSLAKEALHKDCDREDLSFALPLLAKIGNKESLPLFTAALNCKYLGAKEIAVDALKDFEGYDTSKILMEFIEENKNAYTWTFGQYIENALYALSSYRIKDHSDAVPFLISLLEKENSLPKSTVFSLLADYKDRDSRVIPITIKSLRNPALQSKAIEILENSISELSRLYKEKWEKYHLEMHKIHEEENDKAIKKEFKSTGYSEEFFRTWLYNMKYSTMSNIITKQNAIKPPIKLTLEETLTTLSQSTNIIVKEESLSSHAYIKTTREKYKNVSIDLQQVSDYVIVDNYGDFNTRRIPAANIKGTIHGLPDGERLFIQLYIHTNQEWPQSRAFVTNNTPFSIHGIWGGFGDAILALFDKNKILLGEYTVPYDIEYDKNQIRFDTSKATQSYYPDFESRILYLW